MMSNQVRYVQVKPRKLRLIADLARAVVTSDTFLILVASVALGLLGGVVIGLWGGPLR